MDNQVEVVNSNKSYKTLFYGLLAILLVIVSFAFGVWFQSQKSLPTSDNKKQPKVEITTQPSLKISVTTKVMPTIETEPTVSGLSAQEEVLPFIKTAMATKFSKPVSEVEMEISKYEPGFAQGTVRFSGEMAGGWFLAAEVGGQWLIVDDGNGTISCDKIEPYNFPTTIVAECWDEATQDIIYR